MRGTFEGNFHDISLEQNTLIGRMNDLQTVCEALPPKVSMCQSVCRTIDNQSKLLIDKVDTVIKQNHQIQAEKFGNKEQLEFASRIATVVLDIENELDRIGGRAEELQNWMDIYMPLRLQHQISETIKECLPRRGKYLLGVVDQQMCNQLRERMFSDIGSPDLKERCLDVIRELKLEADILMQENHKNIGEAATSWK